MDYLEKVFDILYEKRKLGERKLPNGTHLIGHAPHIAPEAWQHIIFPALTLEEIEEIEDKLDNTFPPVIKDFYLRTNGLSVFSGTFDIYGLRRSFERTGDAVWQPYSIYTKNIDERPRDAKDSFIFLGSYKYNRTSIFIDTLTNIVYRGERYSTKVLNTWNNFEEFLESELDRVSKLFDDMGNKLPGVKDTTPPLPQV